MENDILRIQGPGCVFKRALGCGSPQTIYQSVISININKYRIFDKVTLERQYCFANFYISEKSTKMSGSAYNFTLWSEPYSFNSTKSGLKIYAPTQQKKFF